MAIVLSLGTFLSTLLGGLFALYLQDRLHLILGFSAGALIGVAFFDLIPESLELASTASGQTVAGVIATGFAGYMLLDRTVAPHGDKGPRTEKLWHRGVLGAASLSAHSFLDGFAIGLGFKVSTAVGTIVAAAVVAHDFSDGINTVSVILRNKGDNRSAFRWLLIDAAAPVAGAVSTLVLPVPQDMLGLALALFAGFFLYIGASDLLPESYHDHPTGGTTAMTILGLVAVYAAVRLASL
ncbi:MAG TPA: ZIP family metal transporter [Xanthobacteraceae bacterium]|nr:ZIP family metal transporter [Xanthobacteraceae bacterium]